MRPASAIGEALNAGIVPILVGTEQSRVDRRGEPTGAWPLTDGCRPRHLVYNAVYMAKTQNLGEFEQIVLLAILRLRENAYGVTIRSEISVRTGRRTTRGALYTTLDRLEDKGLVRSKMGDPTPMRGGRAKRYYAVSAAGIRAIAQAQRAYREMLDGLEIPGVHHA